MKLNRQDKRMLGGYAVMMAISAIGLLTVNPLIIVCSLIGYYVVDVVA
jgi:hypothetical protein